MYFQPFISSNIFMNHKKILIISALAEEMLPLTKYLSYEKILSPGEIIEHGNFVFAVSSIGKVSAAMTLTKVLEQYSISQKSSNNILLIPLSISDSRAVSHHISPSEMS